MVIGLPTTYDLINFESFDIFCSPMIRFHYSVFYFNDFTPTKSNGNSHFHLRQSNYWHAHIHTHASKNTKQNKKKKKSGRVSHINAHKTNEI